MVKSGCGMWNVECAFHAVNSTFLMTIARLEVLLDRSEHEAGELLRNPFADGAALDEHRAVDRLDRHVPAIARDAFWSIVEARRLAVRAVRVARRHVRRDRRAVDQHAGGDDQILVDRLLAVIETRRVLAEQREVAAGRNLGDDGSPERALGI